MLLVQSWMLRRSAPNFSSAQLKKQGKRVCVYCVTAAQEHTRNAAHPAPTPTSTSAMSAIRCVGCEAIGGARVRFVCGRCGTRYCQLSCLAAHLGGPGEKLCLARAHKPTAQLHDADQFSNTALQQLNTLLQESTRRIQLLTNPAGNSVLDVRLRADLFHFSFTQADLQALSFMCPLSDVAGANWWRSGGPGTQSFARADALDRACFDASNWVAAIERADTTDTHDMQGKMAQMLQQPTLHVSPLLQRKDPSLWDGADRFFHKLLRHWIYFVRYGTSMNTVCKRYLQVEHDHFGLLPAVHRPREAFDRLTQETVKFEEVRGVAYCSYTPASGKPYLVPLSWRWDSPSVFAVASTTHAGGMRCVLTEAGRIVCERGLVIMGPHFTACLGRQGTRRHAPVIFAYSGLVEGDVNRSFC